MKINIKIHPNSSKIDVKMIEKDHYEVWLKEKPQDNKANLELVKLLKKHFKKPVKIKSGFTSRKKIIEVEE